jgi:hypothetical protein
MGLQIRDVEQVHTAALLHDVGKIHEEFAPLLRKEDRLTPDETALMQTHSARSAELVGIISKFRGFIQESVRHHHERWDGKGYPNGLSGHEIPLASRIILVADTIDAMTTDRPYRKRLPLDVVIGELQKCRGSPALQDLRGNMPVADVPGDTLKQQRVAGDFQHRLFGRDDPYNVPALKREPVAVAEVGSFCKITQKFRATLAFHGDAAAMAAVMRELDAVRFLRAIPGSGRQKFGGAVHSLTQNRKYRCAMGSVFAGWQVSSSPSARTS